MASAIILSVLVAMSASAWWALEDRLSGGRYFAGQHLKRFDSLAEAVDGFYAEVAAPRCALPVRLQVWPDASPTELATTSTRGSRSRAAERGGLPESSSTSAGAR